MPKSAGKLRPRRRPLLAASLGRPGTGGWKTQGLEPPSPHLASSEFSRSTQSDCHSRIKEWGKGGETEAHGRRFLDQGHRMRQRRTETSRGAQSLQPVAPGWAPHAHGAPITHTLHSHDFGMPGAHPPQIQCSSVEAQSSPALSPPSLMRVSAPRYFTIIGGTYDSTNLMM